MSEFNQYRPQRFSLIPPVIKNLLIINVLFFLATLVLDSQGIDMYAIFGLHFPLASDFKVWQPITYMFMHGSEGHIFFNMLALWMFGAQLENYWGSKRFLTYYLVTGIGAAVIHYSVLYFTSLEPLLATMNMLIDSPSIGGFNEFYNSHQSWLGTFATESGQLDSINRQLSILDVNPNDKAALNAISNFMAEFKDYYLNKGTIVVGASGAVYGLLLAFGMLFPNAMIYLYFFVPIRAKYFVILYGALELFMGIKNSVDDNVAHFAHLGGMLFGFILIKYWNKTLRNRMY